MKIPFFLEPPLPLQKPLLLKGGGGAPTELILAITTY